MSDIRSKLFYPRVHLSLFALAAIVFMGCGGDGATTPPSTPDTNAPPAQDTNTPPAPDTASPPAPDTNTPPGPAGVGSIVHDLVIELDATKGVDLDGDGEVDNAMGGMFTNIATLTGSADVNEAMAAAIQDGLLNIGMAWPGVESAEVGSPLNSAGFALYVVNLNDTDGDPSTKDSYSVDPSSFQEGTNIPKTLFTGATIDAGTLTAGPAAFNLGFPYYDVHMQVVIGKASFTGNVTQDENGVALSNGQLTGAVSSRSFVDWINSFVVSDWCPCATGLEQPLLDVQAGLTKDACNANANGTACTGDDETLCSFFINQCSLLMPVMAAFADIDTDADGVADSFSSLMHLQAQGTAILGLPE